MKSELLAPAGDFETALAAFAAGADAVYCGMESFSARAFAKNFSEDDLKALIRYAKTSDKRVYVTFNTLIDEGDLEPAVDQLSRLATIGPDAIIVQDLGIARLARRFFPELELHASTQLVAHNLEGVLALKELGFRRVVLARELSLAEIDSIAKRCGARTLNPATGRPELELEVFIHGALCYSISGLCLYGAMEKGRSGNRGQCPYCCRQATKVGADSHSVAYPFSMKDLRLGEDVRKLVDAGVASLKIEGRMKSPLYVASVTRWYRQLLADAPDNSGAAPVSRRTPSSADLETVFSRRTTELRLNGDNDDVIDSESLGHRGTPIGTVKKITRDREGLAWLRFHTARALEKHDGLQFDALTDAGRHFGFGITEMRSAISRTPVFEVAAGTDVEVLLPAALEGNRRQSTALEGNRRQSTAIDGKRSQSSDALPIHAGDTVYCSMSNAVKRMFPMPAYRPSDYPGAIAVDLEVSLAADGVSVAVSRAIEGNREQSTAIEDNRRLSIAAKLEPAKDPSKTFDAIEKAFSKLGGTDYRLGRLKVCDSEHLFAPATLLNDLRRELVEALDDARERQRAAAVEAALASTAIDGNRLQSAAIEGDRLQSTAIAGNRVSRELAPKKVLKIREGQKILAGFDEVVISIAIDSNRPLSTAVDYSTALDCSRSPSTAVDNPTAVDCLRLALPVWNGELNFNRLRNRVKSLLREGYRKWEASDLATLRMLRGLDITDITADWSLYAFNSAALATLTELGVKRLVASPENHPENLQYLAESGYPVEFLAQQSTPLFISLHRPEIPAVPKELAVYERDGLWVTTKPMPRSWKVPAGLIERIDLSWDNL